MKKLFLVLLLYPSILFGQATIPIKLNELVEIKSKLASANQGYQYIELNKGAFEKGKLVKGAHLLFESKPGVIDELEITRVSHYVEGIISIIAKKVGETNNEFSLSYSNGKVIGTYQRTANETIYLGYQQEVESNFISNKAVEESIPNKGDDSIVPINHSKSLGSKGKTINQAKAIVPNVEAMATALEDTITIDVMLVYTTAAEGWATSNLGSVGNLLSQAMNNSQLALDNSETAIELRLVYQHKTNYDETIDGVDSEKRLRRITSSPAFRPTGEGWEETTGYMDEVHTLRDQYGADLVALIARINDTGGMAWRLSSTAGEPKYAFSINRVQQIANSFTLIHEFGHNMGNAHSRTQLSAAADESGGLFHYSAGYQDKANNFYTIMAYDDGLSRAPIFSSPDLVFTGKQAGTNNIFTPEDNARSMREIKTVIAGYRPSKTNPPILTPITNAINIEMNREDELTVPINIANTGTSKLMWFSDFDIPTNTANKLKNSPISSYFKSIQINEGLKHPSNTSFTNANKAKNAEGESVVYSTSFETNEGFALGDYKAISQWRALSDSDMVKISDVNSKTGTSHLRLESKVGESTQYISSPFFGAQPFGTYEIEMDIAVGGANALEERFDIYIYDGKNDKLTAGVVISEAKIYAWGRNESGATSFYYTNANLIPTGYKKFKIRFDNATETVSYFYGTQLIAARDYIDGRTPGKIYFLHGNNFANTTFDVDNLKLTKINNGYPWLELNTYSGVVNSTGSKNLNLTFNTRGIAAGNYETKLVIETNDPDKAKLEIPVKLSVKTKVSNDGKTEVPEAITLYQNYPNPFNPVTIITFALKETTDVRLEIFTIQGQKVATLFNTKLTAGSHKARYSAENLASGVYLYRLSTPLRTLTRKMTLIK
ncbi:MAG: M12 family metallo-peptidase [Balneolaceae bacterium]